MYLSLQNHSCCFRPDENHIQELICNVKSYYTQTVLSFEWINWKFFTHHKTNNYLYINNLLHKWYWIIHDLLYQVQEAYQRNFSRKNSVNLRLKANVFKGWGGDGAQKWRFEVGGGCTLDLLPRIQSIMVYYWRIQFNSWNENSLIFNLKFN